MERLPHRLTRRLQNVDSINHIRLDKADPDGYGFLANTRFGPFSLPLTELFGVVDAMEAEVFGKNHAGGEDRASKRPSSDFIKPGNQSMAGSTRPVFVLP